MINHNIEDLILKLDVSIKNWYINKYPEDEVGKSIPPTASFLDMNNLLNSGEGYRIYSLLGREADSVIRERCFEKLAEITNQSYGNIYNKWLNKEIIQEEEIEK